MRPGISWLDLKLGIRMLLKYPGLTLVGGLGMAVAIAVGAGSFAFFYSSMYPTLPLEEGDRIVALENWDVVANNEDRQQLHDLVTWREEMQTIREIGAFRTVGRNLMLEPGQAEPVAIAEITPGGFGVARVPPLLGRPLIAEDERPGAPPVLVIGYDVWRRRFASDPAVIGRGVRLGGTVHTIVGVMPEGFAFPENHDYWVPLRIDPARFERGEGPEIHIFGRLAPGATMEEAQAELAAIGRRTAAAYPETHEHIRPQVLPYTYPLVDIQDVSLWQISLMQLMISLLLVVVAANVAVLVYARTATRRGEIAVRTALGASRTRIVGQLFAEALVLATVAALAGLAMAQVVMRQGHRIIEAETGGSPFWADYGVSSATVLYVMALVVLAAVIVGVLPALQATGRGLQASLRQLGGGTGMRLGRTWTVLIVAQVGIAVAALPAAVAMGWSEIRGFTTAPTYPAGEYLAAVVMLDEEGAQTEQAERASNARQAALQAELVQRIEREPGVVDVTYASDFPGAGLGVGLEVEGVEQPAGVPGHRVRFGRVAIGYFDAFEAPVLTGRGFVAEDQGAEAAGVIVNRAFVREVLDGGEALGRRVRYDPEQEWVAEEGVEPGRWYEIVGVVGDLQANRFDPSVVDASVYHAAALEELDPGVLAIRLRGTTPTDFAPRVRGIAAEIDPRLRLGIRPLADADRQARLAMRLVALVLAMILGAVLLLSAAGIYALMSFTVAQRRREIGIRAALGAHPRQIVRAIFATAVRQIGLGLLVGAAVAAALDLSTGGELMAGMGLVLLPGIAMLMLVVGVLAALGPARRGLSIQPSEALKADA